MNRKDKKSDDRIRDEILKNVRANAKKQVLARQVMPAYLADDHRVRRAVFRQRRRDANWNARKQRR
jgi:hypothetical protein